MYDNDDLTNSPPRLNGKGHTDDAFAHSLRMTKLKGGLIGFILGFFFCIVVAVAAVLILNAISVGKMALTGSKEPSQSKAYESSDASGDLVSKTSLSEVLDEDSLEKVEQLIDLFNGYYANDMSVSALQEGIYEGLADGLGDKYSEYYTAEEYAQLKEQTEGEYAGIGVTMSKENDTDNYVTIGYVYEDTPADKEGLKANDKIIAVEGEAITADQDTSEIAEMVRGEPGTKVTITIQRGDDDPFDVTLTRAKVEIDTVEGSIIDDDESIGYVQISQFSNNTADQFAKVVDGLVDDGAEKLIIDLRNNGGGVVDACADILDYLLPEGVTVYTMDKQGERTDYTSDEKTQLNIPMVVLVNGNSASASEIFAAAMMDYDWATLVGTTTYGKGVYQSVISLNDGSGLKITVGKFYSPKGNNFNETGITPDVEVEYENTSGEDAEYSIDTDSQIQKAIEVLEDE